MIYFIKRWRQKREDLKRRMQQRPHYFTYREWKRFISIPGSAKWFDDLMNERKGK